MTPPITVGDVVAGRVLEIQFNGALIGLAEGGTGFLHASEIPALLWGAGEGGLSPGQEVLVKVIGLDRLERPALSMRRVTDQDRDAMAYHREAVEFGSALAARAAVTPPSPEPADGVEWRLRAWLKATESALVRLRRGRAARPSPRMDLD